MRRGVRAGLVALVVVAIGVLPGIARAAVGHLTFAGCVGDHHGCTATTPRKALDGAASVAVSGHDLYVAASGGNAVDHFRLPADGDPSFVGCVGDLSGCTHTVPAGALDGADGVAVSGQNLYVTAGGGRDVSHLTLNTAGAPSFEGCVGDLTGCAATGSADPFHAGAGLAAVHGRRLYVTSLLGVSDFTLDADGDPTFGGCIGSASGCTAVDPSSALNGAAQMAFRGNDLYVAASFGSDVSRLRLAADGAPSFSGCIGVNAPCTSTNPGTALAVAAGTAIGGNHLYATGTNNTADSGDVSELSLDSAGIPGFVRCVGSRTGCSAIHPASALDGAARLLDDGEDLYVATAHGIGHLRLGSTGAPIFGGCIGDLSGCRPTTPADVLDFAGGLARSGQNLYVVSGGANTLSHLRIAGPTLAVALAGSGTGHVKSAPAGIACPAACSHRYAVGTKVTLTATPAHGSKFAGWSGKCTGTGACHLVVSTDRTVKATFKPSGHSAP
ncbi:MAG TPA: hypothetical protein VID47_09555 [Actinomycetota bacterium]